MHGFVAALSLRLSPNAVRTLVALGSCAAALTGGAAGADAAAACSRVAAPSGSDSAAGSEAAPYRTVQKLVTSLTAGQTGCLRTGTYGGSDVTMHRPDVTLTSFPGERATITAFLEVYPEAARARLQNLKFDSTNNGNATGVKLQADGVLFADNELTKGNRGICLMAGTWHAARDIVIERNHIHHCGPSGSKYDHQVYLAGTRNATVRWNVLDANAGGWGVHMYPDADGTLVEHNVIDGNHGGVVFAGDDSDHSDNNVVRYNAVTYSGPRWNIEGSWGGGGSGNGNSAHHNCVYTEGPSSPGGIASADGFSPSSNTVLSGSPYVNRGSSDFTFRSDSPCSALVGDVAGAVAGGSSGVAARWGEAIRRAAAPPGAAARREAANRPAAGPRGALRAAAAGRPLAAARPAAGPRRAARRIAAARRSPAAARSLAGA